MFKLSRWLAATALSVLPFFAIAATPDEELAERAVTPAQDYSDEFIRQRYGVAALGPSLFGDSTGLSTGATEFVTTDIRVPGNSALPVNLTRRYRVDYRTAPMGARSPGLFIDWELDLPHLHGTFARTEGNAASGWQVSTPGQANQRCSVDSNNPAQGQPPSVMGSGNHWSFASYEYWHGNSLYIPGQGDQTLMVIAPGNANRPVDGRSYRWAAGNNWVAACLPSTANGVPGEGFLVVSPEGTKYFFDWFAKVYATPVSAAGGVFPNNWVSYLEREEQYIFPTRIEDRFGNWVTYTFDPANPLRLQAIRASDGRSIDLTYNPAGRIATASTTSRTWTYEYDADNRLRRVILPDSTFWEFDLAPTIGGGALGWRNCADINTPPSGSVIKTITHPSGARGEFTFRTVRHGRSYVPFSCMSVGDATSPHESKFADVVALMRKQITGPGLSAPLVWSFDYGPLNASWTSECTGAPCPTTRTVTVTEPDGAWTRYQFSNRYNAEEGLLLASEVSTPQSEILRSDVIDYQRNPAGQPYPAEWGKKPCYYCDRSGEVPIPQRSRVITQRNVTFSRTVTAFDRYTNPTSVTRASSLGHSRSETTQYHHNTTRWVIGQVGTVTEAGGGAVMRSNSYDPVTATLSSTREFGQPATTFTYHPDGTVWTQADGANQTTTFTNYRRGIAQNIALPDNNAQSAIVNDEGEITSVTNAAGYTTQYRYDLGGRLARIIHPSGDTPAWNDTTLTFVPITNTEYGIAANHWKQTVSTGNARTETYYDALWRPVLSRSYDTASLAGTQRMVLRRFDAQGRETFASYPKANIGSITDPVDGTTTQYDALGRITDVRAASELGTLTTSIRYRDGFQTEVSNPRRYVTTTTFQVFDEPSEAAPVTIQAPLGITTTIARDVFGKPTAITRSGLYNGVMNSATRSFVYDANQRLCKTIEPERGATVQDYDAANNRWWSASGQNLPSTAACDRGSVAASQKTVFGYDTLNRLKTTTFGDGSPPIDRTYTPDGLLETISADNSTWTTVYNRRRLMRSETLRLGTTDYPLSYTYTPNGHVASLSYPDGVAVAYAPNALGEATQVGNYASGITRHANGALANLSYGNGIAHTTQQNTRGLPSRSTDAGVLDDGYTYDENANVAVITDHLNGDFTRTMIYDGRDRLTSATNTARWDGAHTFVYDPLDNLRRSTTQKYGDWTHEYNAVTQRLDRIAFTGPGGASIITYGYDTRGRANARSTSGDAQTFTVDQADRVTGVTGVQSASYSYDGHGHRTRITKSGITTVQVYSQAGQLMYQSSPASNGIFRSGFQTSDTPYSASTGGNKRYVYLGRHLIAEDGTTGRRYIHTDALGSPINTSNSTGAVSARNDYKPYGWGPSPQSTPSFTGHVADAETGLIYMQARYYDPYAGRFMATDPVGASPDSFNRYWYANNNPYRNVDPDGRETASVTLRLPWNDSGGTLGEKLGAAVGLATLGVASISGGAFVATFAATTSSVGLTGAAIVHTPEIVTIGTIGAEATAAVSGVQGPTTVDLPAAGAAVPKLIRTNPKNLIPTQTKNEISGSLVKRLASDMKKNGFDQSKPIDAVRNERGRLEIIDGHHRTEAAKKAGIDEIPVNVWDR
ncbi:MAG: ParB N-terminal domain-containing protein [Rhodanobacteraceae bacterium]|nr:ParB N-terminal domain-containing protein [Rhodanobacteraceae bacterium]